MKILALLLALAACGARGAIGFNGTTTMLTAGPIQYGNLYPLTVSAWVYITGNHEGTVGIIAEMGGVWNFYVSDNDSVTTQAIFAPTVMFRGSPASAVPRNKWTHICLAWDGTTSTNGAHIYINGTETTYPSTGQGSGTITTAAYTLCLGNRLATTVTYNGYLSGVAIWTNQLTVAEIGILAGSRMARAPLMIRPAYLVGYWPMDGGPDGAAALAQTSISDLSGRGYHASPSNSPTWRASALSYP